MKSFQDHINFTDTLRKPVYRSSAIFPFILEKNIDTKIIFLSYWFLKRKITEVSLLITIRNIDGKIIKRSIDKINCVKSYNISLKELLLRNNLSRGSIELEIFSTEDMVFPFPAFSINLVSRECTTSVHSCGRIYNDFDDFISNSKIIVPESGFDILPDKNLKPFFSFVNGPLKLKNSLLEIKIINFKGEKKYKKINFKNICEYETKIIFFLNEIEKKFLKNKKGTVSIKHNFKSFFPRFMCGNLEKNKDFSTLTHSYYDISKSVDKQNEIWKNPNKNIFFDGAVSVPFFKEDNKYTELAIYPNFIEKKFTLYFDIYDEKGNFIENLPPLKINKKLSKPLYLNLTKNLSTKKKSNKNYFLRIFVDGGGQIPTRLKFALNVGQRKMRYNVPSNICFNVRVPNSNIVNKPSTFKWGPIIQGNVSQLLISNISYLKNGFKDANIILSFWNDKKDKKPITKKIKINDNGFYCFDLKKNFSIMKFMNNKTCWVTIQSDNPFVDGWYFNFGKNGVVGADHLF